MITPNKKAHEGRKASSSSSRVKNSTVRKSSKPINSDASSKKRRASREPISQNTNKTAKLNPEKKSQSDYSVNDRIEARYKGEDIWYAGTIKFVHSSRNAYNIRYDDGGLERLVPVGLIRPLIFRVDDLVEGKYQDGKFWYTGKISKVKNDGKCTIQYDDGDVEDDVPPDRIHKLEGEEVSDEGSVYKENESDEQEEPEPATSSELGEREESNENKKRKLNVKAPTEILTGIKAKTLAKKTIRIQTGEFSPTPGRTKNKQQPKPAAPSASEKGKNIYDEDKLSDVLITFAEIMRRLGDFTMDGKNKVGGGIKLHDSSLLRATRNGSKDKDIQKLVMEKIKLAFPSWNVFLSEESDGLTMWILF
mmetsp:Transcript_22700/g.28959  ORF Transcript_22700/g.28959 Transcript_22700/m.28959 type:complete len:363 (-) Transcript_22700:373-1461(-)